MELIHSKFGGSGVHRYWECAGCLSLIEKARAMAGYDPTPKAYTTEGKAAHMLAESCLIANDDAGDYTGMIFEVDNKYISITENMADSVQVYLDSVRNAANTFGTNMSFLEIEKRFNLPDVDPEAFGTNDACLHIPFHKLMIWDYKHGKGVFVSEEFNKQLLFYALGALVGKEDVEEVETILVQPRIPCKRGVVRSQIYPVEKLELFKIELKEKIKTTKNLNAPRKGGDWCKFCDAYPICAEAKKNLWRGGRANTVATAIEDFK